MRDIWGSVRTRFIRRPERSRMLSYFAFALHTDPGYGPRQSVSAAAGQRRIGPDRRSYVCQGSILVLGA
jgi:hypothetical protein